MAVAQIQLNGPSVLPIVSQLVAGGVAQHAWVNREGDASLSSGTTDYLTHSIGSERRLALADEHVGCLRLVPL